MKKEGVLNQTLEQPIGQVLRSLVKTPQQKLSNF